jgi:hypothetical protein
MFKHRIDIKSTPYYSFDKGVHLKLNLRLNRVLHKELEHDVENTYTSLQQGILSITECLCKVILYL